MRVLQINRISNINFTAGYDIHTHTGHWWATSPQKINGAIEVSSGNYAYLKDYSSIDTLEIANKHLSNSNDKIEKMFVSNLDCMVRNHPDMAKSSITPNGTPFLSDEIKGNLDLYNKYKSNPNYVLYATCQPSFGNPQNIERILKTAPDKFKGLKFHPKQLNLRADDASYDGYLELARKYKLPCLFHSQVNLDYTDGIEKIVQDVSKFDKSDPEFIYNLAKRHPTVPIIMGHTGAGGKLAHQKAIDILIKSIDNNDAKLYCDISWVDFENDLPAKIPTTIINLIKKLKDKNSLDRVLFGTDTPLGCYSDNAKISPEEAYKMTIDNLKTAIRENFGNEADSIINKIFYENAHKLFFENTSPIRKTSKNNKALAIILSAIITLGVVFGAKAFIKKQNNNKNSNQENIAIKK